MRWFGKRGRVSSWGEVIIPSPDKGASQAKLPRRVRDLEASTERALLSLEVTLEQAQSSWKRTNGLVEDLKNRLDNLEKGW